MNQERIIEQVTGAIRIIEPDNHIREIGLDAIAAWGELLGYSDPAETLEAIIHVQDNGEPEPDPATGHNVWTDAYTLLIHREQEREKAAIMALDFGTADNPQSPVLRSTLAAYNAVHVPVSGGECVMDRCRRSTRERLGVSDPTVKAGATSRISDPIIKAGAASRDSMMSTSSVDSGSGLAAALTPVLSEIGQLRTKFLHGLTGNATDPLAPAVEVPEPELDPLADTFLRYSDTEASL